MRFKRRSFLFLEGPFTHGNLGVSIPELLVLSTSFQRSVENKGLDAPPNQVWLQGLSDASVQFHVPSFHFTLLTANPAKPGFNCAEEILITIIYP